jgi:hypothetical protein
VRAGAAATWGEVETKAEGERENKEGEVLSTGTNRKKQTGG